MVTAKKGAAALISHASTHLSGTQASPLNPPHHPCLPLVLNSPPHCTVLHCTAGKYDLIGILTHKGRSADSGHYVSWVRQEDGQWVQFDDDKMILRKEEEVLTLSGARGRARRSSGGGLRPQLARKPAAGSTRCAVLGERGAKQRR